jgi:hypothetical protein
MEAYYFIFSFYVLSVIAVSLLCILSQVTCRAFVTFLWCCLDRGDLLSFSFCNHIMMRHFGGYCLGCAGCASGSWSDILRVIGRDHFWSVCLGSFRDRMCYSIVCYYRFCNTLCSSGGRTIMVLLCFFGNHLVSPVVYFSLFAIECICHEVWHGG